jgi:hypothetical protein
MSKVLAVLLELKECSDYWSDYAVPIGIHERIDAAIAELLAQPEQKLMTNRAIIQACPDHYYGMEKEAFKVGIKWYEKYIARIGVYSNE